MVARGAGQMPDFWQWSCGLLESGSHCEERGIFAERQTLEKDSFLFAWFDVGGTKKKKKVILFETFYVKLPGCARL